MAENVSAPIIGPKVRRRAEKLLAPVRLEDPYPEIPLDCYTPAIVSLVSAGKAGGRS